MLHSALRRARRNVRTLHQACILASVAIVPLWPFVVGAGEWTALGGDGVRLFVQDASLARVHAFLPELADARADAARRLGIESPTTIDVYFADDETAFRALMGDEFPHWGVGAAFPGRATIVLMPFRGNHAETLQTARHEVSHILLHLAVLPGGEEPGAGRTVPSWFDEGVAMWVADEWRLHDRMEVFFSVLTGGLTPLAELDGVLGFSRARAHLAYSQSQLGVTYLIELGGSGAVADVISLVAEGTPFDTALQEVSGLSPQQFEIQLAQFVRNRFGPASLATSSPALWFYASILVIVSYVIVRIRNRARVRVWEAEDPSTGLPDRLRRELQRPHLRVFRRDDEEDESDRDA